MRRGWILSGVLILAVVPAVPVAATGVSLVLERVSGPEGVGKWIRTGDVQRFRVRLNGMAKGARVAVATSPVEALSEVSCTPVSLPKSSARITDTPDWDDLRRRYDAERLPPELMNDAELAAGLQEGAQTAGPGRIAMPTGPGRGVMPVGPGQGAAGSMQEGRGQGQGQGPVASGLGRGVDSAGAAQGLAQVGEGRWAA
ncbi:MAG: hypothetical protein HOV96_38750, partial [Nonomuraea sp.]|nr:hypothetical protein [Nonomuraea sp.]